jgi:hypothetical protein
LGIARRLQDSLQVPQNCDVAPAGRCGGLCAAFAGTWRKHLSARRPPGLAAVCGRGCTVRAPWASVAGCGAGEWAGGRFWFTGLTMTRACPSKQAYSGVFLRSAALPTPGTRCARIGDPRGQHACSCIEQSHLAHSPGTARLLAGSSQPCPAPSVESHCQPQQLSQFT